MDPRSRPPRRALPDFGPYAHIAHPGTVRYMNANTPPVDSTKGASSEVGNSKSPSPLLVVSIAAGAIVAGLLAFFVTTRVVSGAGNPCTDAMEEILEVKAAAPDAAALDSRPDLSLRVTNAGQRIFDNCGYREGREFEMQHVEPWLNLAPAPSTNPGSATPPNSSVVPSTSAPGTVESTPQSPSESSSGN